MATKDHLPGDEAVAWPVNIGQAARLSGISPKMLRHYEGMGLLGAVTRTESNYRQYSLNEVHTLRFIRRARNSQTDPPPAFQHVLCQ